MKRLKVSNNVIRRLPRYLRKLDELAARGVTRISSFELGQQLGLTPSQIRQDFSCFGEFGQQGYGYNVADLRAHISTILGSDRGFNAILVGVGNLGRALIENFSFADCGFTLSAAFDINPALIGKSVAGVPVYDGAMTSIEQYVKENQVDVAVLAVPKTVAVDVAEGLESLGVDAIWNFTNVELAAPDTNTIIENMHFSDSLLTLSYFVAERRDEQANKNGKADKE